MKRSKVLDSSKGLRVNSNRRTICEVVRQLYDICIIEGKDNPEMLDKIVPLIEDIFVMGIKMNNKLIDYKMDTDLLFERNGDDTAEIEKRRKERARLVKVLENNEKILKKRKGG